MADVPANTDDKNVLKPDENKVSYNVSISVPNIIGALHQKAVTEAQKISKDKKIRIVNSAIEADEKTAKLKSAGNHIIAAMSTDEDGFVKRSDAITVLKEYVKWYVGPDLQSSVTADSVLKFSKTDDNDNQSSAEDDKQNEESPPESSQMSSNDKDNKKQTNDKENIQNASSEKPNENNDSDDSNDAKNNVIDNQKSKNESIGTPIAVKSFREFLLENYDIDFIFEENDNAVENEQKSNDVQNSTKNVSSIENDDKQKSSSSDEDDVNFEHNDTDPQALGWYIAYELKVKGLKESSSIPGLLKDISTSLFDGIRLTFYGAFGGGGPVITGKDIRKAVHNSLYVDHNKLAEDVGNYLHEKYKNTTDVNVMARDGKTLATELVDAKANVNAVDMKRIQKTAYSLVIKVKEEDPKKSVLNKDSLAKIIRKFMPFHKKFSIDPKKIQKSIIKVENFKDDSDAQSMSSNAARPKASMIETFIIRMKEAKGNDTKHDKFSYANAVKLFNQLNDKFAGLVKNKTANQEKENKRAIELFNQFKKQFNSIQKSKSSVDYKFFDDFLTKYEAFEAGLEESVSVKLLSKRDVVSLLLESLFNDIPASEIFEADADSKKDENERSKDDINNTDKAARKEAEPDFSEFGNALRSDATNWLGKKFGKAAVNSKENIVSQLEDDYPVNIEVLSRSKRKYVAAVAEGESSLHESLESMLMTMLFESNEESSNDSKNNNDDANVKSTDQATQQKPDDELMNKIKKMFNEFKKKFGIKDEEADDIIVLTQKVEESYVSLTGNMLLEADDKKETDKDVLSKLNDIKDITKSRAIKFAQSKIDNKVKQKQVSCRAYTGTAEDVKKELAADNGVDISKYEDALSKHKYATAFVVLKDKKDGDKVIHGSTGNELFNDAAAKSIFKDVLKDMKFDLVSFEGAASKREFNSKSAKGITPDAKVFIASFDIDDDKKNKKKDGDGKKEKKDRKEKQPEQKKPAKAYVLPFDFYKDTEEHDEQNTSGEEPLPSDAEELQTNNKVEGTDLYIFPIKSSKMFEDTPYGNH